MWDVKRLLGALCLCMAPVLAWAADPSDEAAVFFKTHPNEIAVKESGEILLFANREVGLALRKSDGGFQLDRMYGIAAAQDLLTTPASAAPRNLFEIRMILDPKHAGKDERSRTQGSLMGIIDEMAKDAIAIGSHAAKSVSWRWSGDQVESVLHLEWKGLDVREDKGVLDVEVTVTLRADDPLSYWRINVRNRGARYGIERVRFPILPLAPIGDAGEDVLAIPQSRGRLVEAPFKTQTLQGYYTCDYEMQFQALYNKRSRTGIYLATQQEVPCLSHLQMACTPSEITWCPGHFPPNIGFAPEVPGGDSEDFCITYDTVAGPLDGDWFDACQVYRAWALKQSWCRKGPLSVRKDIPKWYKEAPLYFYTTFNDSAEGTHSMEENLRIGADHFREWLDWAGMKLPANFYAWEQPAHGLSVRDVPFHPARSELMSSSGRWAGMTGHNFYDGNYPVVKTLPEFSMTCRRLRRAGGMVCPYIALELFNQGPTENAPYASAAKPGAIRDLFGCIRTWGSDGAWQMCSWDAWWRDRLKETCLLMLRHENIGGFYLDVMRGSCLPCYWTAHGHTAAGGSSMTTGRHELVGVIRDAVRSRDRDAILTGENPSENMIDVIDGMLEFTLWTETTAPLFAVVYQDYIPRYGLEISTGTGYRDRFADVYRPDAFFIECASLFCEGAQIGRLRLRPRDTSLSFQNPEHREMIDFLGQVVGYYKQVVSRKFLVYGQLMRPVEFTTPSPMPTLTYTAMYVKTPSQFPALMSGVFKAENGELGVFVVNVAEQETEFAAEWDPVRYGIAAGVALDVNVISPEGESRSVYKAAKGGIPLKGTLPGRRMILFHLKPAAR